MTIKDGRGFQTLFKRQSATKICLFVIDAGAGHRATANAILDYLPDDREVEVAFVNPYTDVLSRGGWFERLIARNSEAHYNFLLKHSRLPNFMWRFMAWMPLVFRTFRGQAISRLFRAFYHQAKPDLVICVLPFIGVDVIEEAEAIGIPNMMIVTDHSETYRNSWIPKEATHLVAFSEQGYRQGLEREIAQVWRLSGPVLRRGFFTPAANCTMRLKQRFGFSSSGKVVMVFYGGTGSPKMLSIARALQRFGSDLNVIFVCGHNRVLKQELIGLKTSYTKRVFGFVRKIGLLMDVSDVMIGKPGPGSAFEAVAKGVYPVLEVTSRTMPHELDNARMIAGEMGGATFATEVEMLTAVASAPMRGESGDGTQPAFRSDLEFSKIFEMFLDGQAQWLADDSALQ